MTTIRVKILVRPEVVWTRFNVYNFLLIGN